MIVYVQWAKSNPDPEWITIDLDKQSVLNRIQNKPQPTGTESVDDTPGWINAVNCQGLVFEGFDGYNFQLVTNGIKITAWQNDPDDYSPDEFFACEYTLLDPAPDPRIGNRINTRQIIRIWAAPAIYPQYAEVTNATVFPWSEFTFPTAGKTFYGVWLPDSLFIEHKNAQSPHGWREWIN